MLRPDGRRVRQRLEDAVRWLLFTRDGARLVGGTRRPGALVLDGRSGAPLGSLPARAGRVVRASHGASVVTHGRGIERWDLAPLRPRRLGPGAGITGLAVVSSGVYVSRGDGSVEQFDRATGESLGRRALDPRVLKGIAALPDGSLVVVGLLDDAYRLEPGLLAAQPLGSGAGRRVAVLQGVPIFATWTHGGLRRDSPAGLALGGDEPWVDLAVDASQGLGAGLDARGGIWTVDARFEPVQRGAEPSARAVDALPDGGVLVVGEQELFRVSARGRERLGPGVPGALDLAVSPSGGAAACGRLDGAIEVRSLPAGEPLAVLRGHQERVSVVEFVDDDTLVSGSWDGDVRFWDLSRLRVPAAELAAAVRQAWGGDVEEGLAPVGIP